MSFTHANLSLSVGRSVLTITGQERAILAYFLMYSLRIQQCNTVKHMVLLGMGLALERGCLHGGRKILEGETTFRLDYMKKFRSRWSPSGEGKQDEIVGL